MTDREMLEQCREHFKLLKTFAESVGPIKMENKIIGKAKVIAFESQAAIDGLTKHLARERLENLGLDKA